MKAVWKDQIIAESDNTVVVEGNHYFPYDSVKWNYLKKTNTTSTCPWKGKAEYFSVTVDENQNIDSAWTYPEPKEAASEIKGHVAFYKGIEVS